MTKATHVFGFVSLVAVGIAGQGGCGEAPSIETTSSALAGQVAVAFKGSGFLLVSESGPGIGFNTGQAVKSGTVPSQAGTSAQLMKMAFQGSNSHFFLGDVGSFTDSGGLMAAGTSPSISRFSGGQVGFGIQGANGHLWVGSNGPFGGIDTGGVMAAGSSPSVAARSDGNLAFAMRGSNGHLWIGLTGPFSGVDTGGVMASGTSPSIATTPDGHVAFAMRGSNGNLWIGMNGPFSGFDTGFPMRSGTSPAATGTNSSADRAFFAFQSAVNGHLLVYQQDGNTSIGPTDTGITMASNGSPGVVGTSSGFQAWGRGNNGHLWVATGPSPIQREDQGILMD